jgi:hypothetical protein
MHPRHGRLCRDGYNNAALDASDDVSGQMPGDSQLVGGTPKPAAGASPITSMRAGSLPPMVIERL